MSYELANCGLTLTRRVTAALLLQSTCLAANVEIAPIPDETFDQSSAGLELHVGDDADLAAPHRLPEVWAPILWAELNPLLLFWGRLGRLR